MKKSFVLLLAICLVLSGCSLIPEKEMLSTPPATLSANPIEMFTEPETTAPVYDEILDDEPIAQPGADVCFNPLNGEILSEPFRGRIFGVTINNLREAVPHSNVSKADFFFETFVNGSIIRGFAMFTDPSGLEAIGPVRSDRLVFNDLCMHYDVVMAHAGGSTQVMNDAKKLGIDHFNIDSWGVMDVTSFRDQNRQRAGYGWEHILFAKGDGLIEYASQSGIRMESDPERYFQKFTADATPADGVTAESITVTITVNRYKKDTTMNYDAALNKYVWNQYGKDMIDERTGEPEAFTNVLILMGNIPFEGEYQRPSLMQGGEGWFACGGKAIPIKWGCDSETSPLWFTTMDDEPLLLNQGNTYVAITQTGSAITGIGD